MPMEYADAWKYVGGLSRPGKMPCFGYGLPAWRCNRGSVLRKIKNSTCSKCYALKGHYRYNNVAEAQERRYQSIYKKDWVDAFTVLLRKEVLFRWHDSGDLDSEEHLLRIVQIAERSPHVRFWLPTREAKLVKGRQFPSNLTVRVSDAMIDGMPVTHQLPTSGVSRDSSKVTCPARQQGNRCLECRACWDPDVARVIYALH